MPALPQSSILTSSLAVFVNVTSFLATQTVTVTSVDTFGLQSAGAPFIHNTPNPHNLGAFGATVTTVTDPGTTTVTVVKDNDGPTKPEGLPSLASPALPSHTVAFVILTEVTHGPSSQAPATAGQEDNDPIWKSVVGGFDKIFHQGNISAIKDAVEAAATFAASAASSPPSPHSDEAVATGNADSRGSIIKLPRSTTTSHVVARETEQTIAQALDDDSCEPRDTGSPNRRPSIKKLKTKTTAQADVARKTDRKCFKMTSSTSRLEATSSVPVPETTMYQLTQLVK